MRFLTTTFANNRAGTYERIEVVPMAGSLGAEVTGVDVTALDDATFVELQRCMADHLVVALRGQDLDPDSLATFAARWGEPGEEPFVGTIPENDRVIRVVKEAEESHPLVFGGAWHSDYSFLDRPPAYTFLYGIDVPTHGGDTMWTNGYLAWEHLSEGLQRTLRRERGLHSPRNAYGSKATHNDLVENMDIRYGEAAHLVKEQPLARVHPVTGRTSLFVNPGYTIGIAGWRPEESQPLLDHLVAVATNPAFQCRFRWSPGSLVIWDNRATMHHPVPDYFGARREMIRTTAAGEVPVPADAA